MTEKEEEELFQKILKESEIIKKELSTGSSTSNRVLRCIKAIEKTTDPTLVFIKWRIPITIILEALSNYSNEISLRKSKDNKVIYYPNLPDIETAINLYSEKLEIFSKNFDPKKVKFSDLKTIEIDRKAVVSRLNYGLKAAEKCNDPDERRNLIGIICDIIEPVNMYIGNLNSVIGSENERRQEKDIKPLDEIDTISRDELKQR
jgi:hypothetical protein